MSAIDKKINDLFEVVRKQKAEVEAAEKEAKKKWVTNCSIVLPNGSDKQHPINIQTASESVIKLVVIELLKHREYSQQAEKMLGLGSSEKYDAYEYSQWFDDCKKRIASLSLISKKDSLAGLEKRLNGIVSPEQKRQMELDEIEKSLKA